MDATHYARIIKQLHVQNRIFVENVMQTLGKGLGMAVSAHKPCISVPHITKVWKLLDFFAHLR